MIIEGRTFVVSGGASGLGRACVRDIVKSGGNAAVIDMNEETGAALAKELGSSIRFFQCDVTDTESIASVVKSTLEWIKETGKPLGGIIPAAGVGSPGLMLDKSLNPLSLSSIDFVLSINLRGVLDLVRQFLPALASSPAYGPDGEHGVIVMVASSAAFDGQMGQVSYAASKGAVAAMTLPMARDLSRFGIRVVTIAPSMFDSAMTAMMSDKVRTGLKKAMEFPSRAGQPEEFASLARQAIENVMLNGVVIRLDGATRMPSKLLFATMSSSPLKVAVLDDYQGISEPKFKALDSSKYEVSFFKDTLRPYNHPDTTQDVKDQLVKRLEPFTVISTMRERTPFPRELISRLPNLKLLLTTGNRNLGLDLDAFKERGIPVAGAVDKSNPGSVGSVSTTEHCVTMILAAARNVAQDDRAVKTGGWQTVPAVSLRGKTLGTVGLGRLGVAVAKIMSVAFGMKVVAWSSNLTQEKADEQAAKAGLPVEDAQTGEKTFKVVSKEELFSTADVVSVHLVLSDRSRGGIAKKDLELMKKTAIFVNTSRGPLVVEEDLLQVLEQGMIRAAALDVFNLEPLPLDSKWRTTKWGEDGRSRVLLTPHMGYVEEDTLSGWYDQQIENLEKWVKGEQLSLSLY
ncbi:uncharacterized protein B0T23DRAFT_410737 [Neurospora hispaniola]|uniref:Ketoreductase domain-containing protein n=1 Tax=Neurospora hispaniola TaxID=588809 RepID=A0AAJ0ICQ1_9PEZI|nr:hypothetical protein B0T23DRAFT_410737 [Neurospora hispaniola]